MTTSKKRKKPWIKVDNQLLLLKQGEITSKASKQIYRIRVVRWAGYQAVLQKRLYVFSDQLMDYVPGRLMGFNMDDMKVIYQNQDKINKIMQDIFEKLCQEKTYKERVIEQNRKNNQNKGKIL